MGFLGRYQARYALQDSRRDFFKRLRRQNGLINLMLHFEAQSVLLQRFLGVFAPGDVPIIAHDSLDAGVTQEVIQDTFNPLPGAVLMTHPVFSRRGRAWLLQKFGPLNASLFKIVGVNQVSTILPDALPSRIT